MKENIDDGEVELSVDSSSNVHGSLSVDSFLNDIVRNTETSCTHTHTCNPPGPDAAHTHTCYHTHTHVFPSEEDDASHDRKSPRSKRRPLGNREAVRKYREKKKAHATYLEEEVKKLRSVNQQLIKKLQRQSILETEVMRLRGLLLDLRGKIDNELGALPLQKQYKNMSTTKEGECGIKSSGESDLPCLAEPSMQVNGNGGCGKTMATWGTNCQPPTIDCQANPQNAEKCFDGLMETMLSSRPQTEN